MINIKVIEKDSKTPGKHVVIMACVHGNEVCGVKACDKIIPEIKLKAGKVTFIYANLEAIKQNKRFVEYNLNRAFLKNLSEQVKNTIEGRTAQEIMPYLDKADLLLDVHASNSKKSAPCIICQPHSFEFAKIMPFEIISCGWDSIHPGSTDHYMNRQGKIALCAECGYLADPKSQERAETAILNFLIKAGVVQGQLKPNPKQKFLEVVNLYKNKNESFKISKQFPDFKKLTEKTLIGYDGNIPVFRKKDDIIIFARNKDKLNDECFVTAREITS